MVKPIGNTRRFQIGQRQIDPDDLNVPLDVVRRMRKQPLIQGGIEASYVSGSGISTVIPDPRWVKLGVIADKGPNEEDDFTDARYWVEAARISNIDASNDDNGHPKAAEVEAWPSDHANYKSWVVTNLPEVMDESHLLFAGTPIFLYKAADQATPMVYRYYTVSSIMSSIHFCVVWEPDFVLDDPSVEDSNNRVKVRILSPSNTDPWDGQWLVTGESAEAVCYPGYIHNDFDALKTSNTTFIPSVDQAQKLYRSGRVWVVEPHAREPILRIDDIGLYRLSDCGIQEGP